MFQNKLGKRRRWTLVVVVVVVVVVVLVVVVVATAEEGGCGSNGSSTTVAARKCLEAKRHLAENPQKPQPKHWRRSLRVLPTGFQRLQSRLCTLDIKSPTKDRHARVSAPAARCDRSTVAHLDGSRDSASGLQGILARLS